MSEIQPHKWILLTHQIPSQPSGFRVKIWRRLQGIGRIVHDADLKDGKFGRRDTEGIEKAVRALGSRLADAKLLEVGMHLLDGLLEIVEEEGMP